MRRRVAEASWSAAKGPASGRASGVRVKRSLRRGAVSGASVGILNMASDRSLLTISSILMR